MNASLSQKERRMMRNVIKDATKCRERIHLSRSAISTGHPLGGVNKPLLYLNAQTLTPEKRDSRRLGGRLAY